MLSSHNQKDQQQEDYGCTMSHEIIPLNQISDNHSQNIEFFDQKLNIKNSIIIGQKRKNQKISTQIIPIDNSQGAIQQIDHSQNSIQQEIFSFIDHQDSIQKCTDMLIENCSVNIYTIKKLIKHVSSSIIHITISNCNFYLTDESALKQQQQSKKNLNNKMLREINFSFLVKSLRLPKIESINIQLKESALKEEKVNQSLKRDKRNEEMKREIDQSKLKCQIEKYKCHPESAFIQLKQIIKSTKEKRKKKKSKNSTELFNYLVQGNTQNDSEIDTLINQNIVKDINEQVRIFNKYIKNSFHKNGILIIYQDCFENPLALVQINSLITKYQNKIKTIMFKETGTIKEKIFYKVTDLMLGIPNLESLAFFSSQPEFNSEFYLKEVIAQNKLKFIVLNRSAFDLDCVQVQESNFYVVDKRMQERHSMTPTPSHYGYFILDNTGGMTEFTPFTEQLIKEILNKERLDLEDPEYQIEALFSEQKKWSEPLQSEIRKYQDLLLLNDSCQSERIMIKYQNVQSYSNLTQNQLDFLYSDLKQILKYCNSLNSQIIDKMYNYITDHQQQREINSIKSESWVNFILTDIDENILYQKFLIDMGLIPYRKEHQLRGFNLQYQFKQYQKKKIARNVTLKDVPYKQIISYFQEMIQDILKKKENKIGVRIKFGANRILFSEIITKKNEGRHEVQVYKQRFSCKKQNKKQQQQFSYKSEEFNQQLKFIFSKCVPKNNDILIIELAYSLVEDGLVNKHLSIINELNSEIQQDEKQIKINLIEMRYIELNEDFQINSLFVQNLKISHSIGQLESSFINNNNKLQSIVLQDCRFTYNDSIQFQNIKQLKFIKCSINDPQLLIEEILNKNEQVIDVHTLPNIQIEIQLAANSDSIAKQEICIDLNEEVVSKIYSSKNIRFILHFVSLKTAIYFKDFKTEKKTFDQLNSKILSSLFFKNDLNLSSQIINDNRISLQPNQLQLPSDKLENKPISCAHQFEISRLRAIFENDNEQIIDLHQKFFCQSLEGIQSYNRPFSHFKHQDTHKFINYVGKCCLDILNKEKIDENLKILNQFKDHQDNFCLLTSSFFQDRFQPKKIAINFFKNCFINESLIYDWKALDHIEELDFSSNIFTHQIQVRFIDYLIQFSPHLTTLKLKKILISEGVNFKLSQIRSLNLKHLDIRGITISQSQIILQAVKEVITFESIKLDSKGSFSLFSELLIANQESLKTLYVKFDKGENISQIKFLKVLQRLIIYEQDDYKIYTVLGELISESLKEMVIFFQSIYLRENEIQKFISYQQNYPNLVNLSLMWGDKKNYCRHYQYENQVLKNNNNKQLLKICRFLEIQEGSEAFRFEYSLLSINQANNQQNIEQISPISNYEFLYLQELILSNDNLGSYSFLNRLFAQTQHTLTLFQISNENLDNFLLIDVDFSLLPQTIRKIIFQSSKLNSLYFLEPVYENIEKYSITELDVSSTNITLSLILKYTFYIKKIRYAKQIFNNYFIPLLQYLENGRYKEQYQLLFISEAIFKGNSFRINPKRIRFFLNLLFHGKFQQFFKRESINHLIVSPFLSISLQPVDFDEKVEKLMLIERKSARNSSFDYPFENLFIIVFAYLISNSSQYILGYSKNYFSQFILQEGDYKERYIQSLIQNKNNLSLKAVLPLHRDLQFNHDQKDLNVWNKDLNHFFLEGYEWKNDDLKKLNSLNTNDQIIVKKNEEFLKQEFNKLSALVQSIKYEYNDELDIIEELSISPPATINIKDFSISFIKIWFVINSISPLSNMTTITFEQNQIYNTSVGNYIGSKLARNSIIRQLLKSDPKKYRYDQTVYFLAQHFEKEIEKKHDTILSILFPLYVFTCIFGVIFFSLFFDIKCGNGISWYSYYTYLIYGLVSLLLEMQLFTTCLGFISHLIPSIEINQNPSVIIKMINKIKQFIIDSPYINQWYVGYSYSFLQSQLARFDNFTNVGFLYSTYQCGDYHIFYISLCFISIPFLHSLYRFFVNIFKSEKNKLPTSSLDRYYNLCNILEFRAVADILDLVSPSNVTIIKGRMFNTRIISSLISIVGESIPLVILQIYNLSQKKMTSSLVLSFILSSITFLTLLINFLTITPSTLDQEDFNLLNEKKIQENIVQKYEQRLQEFENESFAQKIYERLKEMRLKYLTNLGEIKENMDLINKNKSNQRYFKNIFDKPWEEVVLELEQQKKQIVNDE